MEGSRRGSNITFNLAHCCMHKVASKIDTGCRILQIWMSYRVLPKSTGLRIDIYRVLPLFVISCRTLFKNFISCGE